MSDKVQVIYECEDSMRLDKFLAGLNIQELYSRTFIEHLIEEDRIIVNKIPVKKSYLLKKGDEIEISIPE
ncbi:MAG TPA: S4 domain-containing protein, partial [Candidatus Syntrophosphaera thermopropionivorans]|nr:S4 domain-containing protein [Candidatus Syntrophosphaera thermopropionivorans]